MRLFLTLLVSGTCAATGFAQHTSAASSKPKTTVSLQANSLTPASLHTDTLNYGDDVKRIYAGDFDHVSIKRDSTEFALLVSGYMTEYSESCARYLPEDKVEIMEQECATEQYMVNGYGVEQMGSRHCTSYRTVGSGRYADPHVYSLQKRLDAGMAQGMIGDLFKGLSQTGGDATSGMKKMTDVAVYVKQDMNHFLDDNGCATAATMRFQENMLHYGKGEEPIRMAGAADAVKTASLANGQNYKQLVDDLISEESHAWMMNRYEAGSALVNAVQHDSGGVPREIEAGYSFSMMGQSEVGHVRITFEQGVPTCLYFSDAPAACRAPNPRITSAYKRNQYADANAPAYPETAPEPERPSITRASTVDMATVRANNIAARQAVIRSGAPLGLSVRTMDLINESNAGSGAVFRARLDRPVLLRNAELSAGTIVYLKVDLTRRQAGPSAYFDMYSIAVNYIVDNGKAIALPSTPIQVSKHVSTVKAFRPPGDLSAIPVGSPMNFMCTQP